MTTIYKFYIRYYRTTKTGRKSYYNVESPAYLFNNVCSEAMRDTMQLIVSNQKYTIDAFWIESILVDSVDLKNFDTVLTEHGSMGPVNTDDDSLPF